MNKLLVIENNQRVCDFFGEETEFFDISNLTFNEALVKLSAFSGFQQLYFPIELKFKGGRRLDLDGLALFKHIRLTGSMGSLQFTPILLGYSFPVETLLRNPESAMLCSPGVRFLNLQHIRRAASNSFFQLSEKLTKDTFRPYVLFSDQDESKSEHDIRNEHGPLKLKRELTENNSSDLPMELWQKKALFLQPVLRRNGEDESSLEEDFKTVIKGKNILYIDDEASRWEKVLKKLYDGATMSVKRDYQSTTRYFDQLQNEQMRLRGEYEDLDGELLKIFFSKGNDSEFRTKRNTVHQLKNQLSMLLNYDLILLDMRLDKTSDSNKPIGHLSGMQILSQIQKISPFIPVIMFTASNKIESYREVTSAGAYDFWIKNVSSVSDLKRKSLNLLTNELTGQSLGNLKNVYASYLMIKSRVGIFNYSTNDATKTIISEPFSNIDRDRIDDAVLYFINFIQRYIMGTTGSVDIEELWKFTGDSIQIRVPAIYNTKGRDVKSMDRFGKISSKEFDFRWNRNYFTHSELDDKTRNRTLDPYDTVRALEYIKHTIDFLMDYR